RTAGHRRRRGRAQPGHAHRRGAAPPRGSVGGRRRWPFRQRQPGGGDPSGSRAVSEHLHGGQCRHAARPGGRRTGGGAPPGRRAGPLRHRQRRRTSVAGEVDGVSTNGARRAALAVAGAFVGRAVLGGLRAVGVRWERTNYRGRTVDLAGGPALGTAATVTAAAGALIGGQPAAAGAALTAGLGAGGVGLYDDVVGGRPEHQAKGFHGHVRALRRGRVTSGVVKIVGAGAAGLAAAALLEVGRPARSRWHRLTRIALGAGVVAGGANLFNLLDLRPGRALKAGVLAGAPLMAS